MSIINCLMSLRKVCNHPDLFETRQIVTSLAMPRSAVAGYEIKELLVRRRLLSGESVDLDYCGLIPVANESERNLVVQIVDVALERLGAGTSVTRGAFGSTCSLLALARSQRTAHLESSICAGKRCFGTRRYSIDTAT